MPKINSFRSAGGLFLIMGLGCGLIFLAVVLKSRKLPSTPSALVWKNAGSNTSATFSGDGKTIVLLGNSCQRFDTLTHRLLSSWKARMPDQTYLTPGGRSLIHFDSGMRGKAFQAKAMDLYPEDGRGPRVHIRSITPFIKRSLSCFDTQNGLLRWKIPLPDCKSQYFYSPDKIVGLMDSNFLISCENCDFSTGKITQTLRMYSYKDGKLLKSTPSLSAAINAETHYLFTDWTCVYRKNGQEMIQTISSCKNPTALELKEGSVIHKFQISGVKPWLHIDPLVLDKSEKFLAGTHLLNPGGFEFDSDDGRFYLWSAAGKQLGNVQVNNFQPKTMAFSPDSKLLAVGGFDFNAPTSWSQGRLLIYSVPKLKLVKELSEATSLDNAKRPFVKLSSRFIHYTPANIPGFTGPIKSLVWSPDSHLLGATDFIGEFKLWRTK